MARTLKYLVQNKLKLSKYKEICYLYEEGQLKLVREFEPPQSYQKFQRTGGDLGLVICRFQCDNNHIELLSPEKYDMPRFTGSSITAVLGDNTQLMMDISNSNSKRIEYLINQTKNINKYNLRYGNNPILLSISKGYNHTDSNHTDPQTSLQQKNIINKLLEREDLDINCIHLNSGMIPLHIACLRGDSPELIQKLLDKGANLNAVDYYGNKPNDLLSYSYEKVQIIIQNMTGKYKFGGKEHSHIKLREDQSYTATLPTREERESNIQEIREILSKNSSQEKEQSSTNSSTIGKPLVTKINSLQIEAQNSVER
ncbi:MAG: ankyrin repeat domain-containing protein [Wolbachia sp.]